MPVNSVLLSGCSFSDFCGWGSIGTKNNPQCWYNILAKEHHLDMTNISYGGRSNREIIHLASEEILSNTSKYDTVILQLTSLGRYWFFREKNPNEFCIINGSNISNTQTDKEYHALKTIQLEFSPDRIEVEKDIVSLLMLQSYLCTHSINLIIIDTMNAGKSFISKRLGSQIDLTYSSGFDKSWQGLFVDYADDKVHPGKKTNIIFAELAGKAIEKLKAKHI
jgi:hypothetical protein